MITRYTPSSYGSMSEKENGEYVKYSDYEELVNRITKHLGQMNLSLGEVAKRLIHK